MKDLGKWQIVSFISRISAMLVGILQSFILLRILSVEEWGVVRIAQSLGSALGIYQHLGLAGASTREISKAKSDKEIFKVFTASVAVRYLVSIPLSIGLYLSAGFLAQKYNIPQIEELIRLYALVMIAQGVQSIFNSIVSGTQRFKRLFIYQTAISFLSLALYVPLVFYYRINGYFYALLLFNIIASFVLAIIAFAPLKNWFEIPSKQEFIKLFKELFSISMAIFLVKILYTNWENIGPNLLGLSVTPVVIGLFEFAALYAKKILTVSDSVTDVNLAVFSEKYENDKEGFSKLFRTNFNKIFVLILLSSYTAVIWGRELTAIAVGLDKYGSSIPLIFPLVFAFVFYSFLDIMKSSILVPAKNSLGMVISYAVLILSTLLVYYLITLNGTQAQIMSMALSMCVGTILALTTSLLLIRRNLGVWVFTHEHWIIISQVVVISFLWQVDNILIKGVSYILATCMFIWSLKVSNLVDLYKLWQEIKAKIKK